MSHPVNPSSSGFPPTSPIQQGAESPQPTDQTQAIVQAAAVRVFSGSQPPPSWATTQEELVNEQLYRSAVFNALHGKESEFVKKMGDCLPGVLTERTNNGSTNGSTLLHEAAWYNYPNEIVNALINAYKRCELSLDLLDEISQTPLDRAIESNHEEIVKLLIQAGASLTQQNGLTPLHRAALYGRKSIVELLVNAMDLCDINSRNGAGTALDFAMYDPTNGPAIRDLIQAAIARKTTEAKITFLLGRDPSHKLRLAGIIFPYL